MHTLHAADNAQGLVSRQDGGQAFVFFRAQVI